MRRKPHVMDDIEATSGNAARDFMAMITPPLIPRVHGWMDRVRQPRHVAMQHAGAGRARRRAPHPSPVVQRATAG
jgi:hypothetical protein